MAFDFNTLLGADSPEEKRAAVYAEGAKAGVVAVNLILERLTEEYADEPPAFFEGLFDAIRTEI